MAGTPDIMLLLQQAQDDKNWLQQQQQQFQQQFAKMQEQYDKEHAERQELSKKWEGACKQIPDLMQKLESANVKTLKLKSALNARGALPGRCCVPAVGLLLCARRVSGEAD